MKIVSRYFLVLTLICMCNTNIFSQSYQSVTVGYQISSGVHNENNIHEYDKVFETNIIFDNVPWIQLIFGDYNLGNNSFIKIIYDEVKECIINNYTIKYWSGCSALLRGKSFHLELYKATNDNNLFFNIDSVKKGIFLNKTSKVLLCNDDTRVRDNSNPNIGRIRYLSGTNYGTGWLTKTQKVITAEHVVHDYNGGAIIEFNVPSSLSDGTPVPSDVMDQYVISGVASNSNGSIPGYDWASLWVQENGYTGHGLFTNRPGIDVRRLDANPPATTLTIIGYGDDNGIDKYTMQKISGPITSVSNYIIQFPILVAGGNSGGPLLATIEGKEYSVGIVTTPGCQDPNGNNAGTSMSNPDFWTAVDGNSRVTFINLDGGDYFNHWFNNSWGNNLNSGTSVKLQLSQNERLKADQGIVSNKKFNYWNSENNIINFGTFYIDYSIPDQFTAKFTPIHNINITIKNNSIENPSLSFGSISLLDPWHINITDPTYGSRNGGMEQPESVGGNSPFVLSQQQYQNSGIFLNQSGPTVEWSIPYYSVSANSPILNNNHNYYFVNWSADITDAAFKSSDNIQTGVEFLREGSVVNANFKGTQFSDNQNSFENSSQRKVIRTGDGVGVIHLVYESMNKVWYEKSTDDGVTWIIANGGQPLSTYNAKLPSIDSDVNGNIGIVFQELYGDSYSIQLVVFNVLGNLQFKSTVQPDPPIYSNDFNATPIIAWGSGMMVVWKEKNGHCFYRRLGYYSNPNPTDMIWTTEVSVSVDSTDDNSSNPTIDVLKDGNGYPIFHLAWQQGTTTINYCTLTLGNYSTITQSTPIKTFSAGFTNNSKPSIVSVTGGARLTWVGNRTTSGGGGASKIMAGGTTEQKAVFVDPANQTVFWSFSNGVQSSVINKSPDCYSIAWGRSNTAFIQFTDSHTLQNITTLDGTNGITGNDLQLSNGNHDYLMRAVSFNNATAPYYFKNKNLYTQAPPKIVQNAINNGREGIVKKDSCQFYFGVGDVKADNKIIEFTPISDTTHFQSLADLNSYLVTNPIQINNNSELYYSVQYGITDSAAAINALKANTHINFKVEILDAVTGEVFGESDNVNFDSLHIFEYNNIAYQVNTEGMGNRTIKIRLKITTNSNIEYSLKSSYSTEEVILQKSKTNHRVVLNLTKVNSYDLSQNYPNPFNPSTTIKYQIPKAGIVTLKVYDILGKEVASLLDEYKNEGRYSINFNASKLASGVYIYQIKASE